MKINIWGYIIGLSLAVVASISDAAAVDITAQIQSRQVLTITSVGTPNISNVIPSGEFSESILGSPWRIVVPIEVVVAVENNTTAQFVTFTDHVHQTYWTRSDTASFQANAADPTKQLNGLINVDRLLPDNTALATVPLRVWADVDGTSIEPNDNDKWAWVLDSSFGTRPLPILGNSVISKNNLKLLYRMSWNAEKLPGTYTGKLFIGLVTQ